MWNKPIAVSAVILMVMGGCNTASAQTALAAATGPVASAGRTDQLEEITVTARKVSEDARKVPASITVVSGADLAEQHITDIADLTRAVPNLSFSSQGGPGNQNIELRGISRRPRRS
jgi:iron complex outermembrane recepter protein